MGDIKMRYGNRLRLDVRYPGKPARGLPEPAAEIPVHYMDARLFVACRKPGAGMRLKTRLAEKVTCPACLKLLNLPAPSQQPSCGATAGSTTLSAESAQYQSAKKPIIMQDPPLVVPPRRIRPARGFC